MASVSVVIPVHNGEAHLGAAIESVLAQRHRPLDVIVVDDGSTDGSLAVARRFPSPVRADHAPHAGAAAARNRGVRLAGAEFLAFLDADDLWTPDKLAVQLEAFRVDPSLDLVLGHATTFHDARPTPPAAPATEAVPGYSHCAMLIRRAAFLDVGWFDDRWRVGEFVDWYARACDAGLRSRMVSDVVFQRRLHAHNHGIRGRAHHADYVRVVKAALDRRRQR